MHDREFKFAFFPLKDHLMVLRHMNRSNNHEYTVRKKLFNPRILWTCFRLAGSENFKTAFVLKEIERFEHHL